MSLITQARLLDSAINDLNVVAASQLLGLWAGAGSLGDVFIGFQPLIKPFLTAGAMITAQWYNRLAPAAGYQAEPIFDIPDDRIDANVHWALFSPGEMHLERLAGTTQRMVYDSSRQTVVGNVGREKGARWVRYAGAGCCEFCAVLATRGPVYRSEERALVSHDHCKCTAVAIRPTGPSWIAPNYYEDFENEYADATVGIVQGDSIARDLGIAGEVPNIRNVSQYMRAVRGGAVPGEAGLPAVKAKPKKPLTAIDAMTADWNRRYPDFQIRPTERSSHTAAYATAWGGNENPGVVRDYLTGVQHMLDKYPQIRELAAARGYELSLGSIDQSGISAWMRSSAWGKPPFARIEFRRGQSPHIPGSAEWASPYQFTLPDGTQWKGRMPFLSRGSANDRQATSWHETGHMMDFLTSWRASNNVVTQKLLPAFLEDYTVKSPMEGIDAAKATPKQIKEYGTFLNQRDADFMRWMYDNQSRYSFITADNAKKYGKKIGAINPVELVAEAVADVEANGAKASKPSQLIHEYLLEQLEQERATWIGKGGARAKKYGWGAGSAA